MKKFVVVDISGGLANQVFLFEIAKFVASIKGYPIIINKSHIDRNHSGGRSTIEDFELPSNVKFVEFGPIVSKILFKLKIMLRKVNSYSNSPLFILDHTYDSIEPNELHDLVSSMSASFIHISGVWQNFTYFTQESKYSLRTKREEFELILQRFYNTKPALFHYRLGEINGKWENGWGALSPHYLIEALDLLSKNSVSPSNIWVFSNDIVKAKHLIELSGYDPKYLTYIDDSNLSPAEVFTLFSKAESLICSNSTFSLLAAKLGDVKNVVAPSELSRYGKASLKLPIEWKTAKSTWLN